MKEHQEIIPTEVFKEAIVVTLLLAGAKSNIVLEQTLFPDGIPFFVAALLNAFAIATVCRAVLIAIHYFIPAYNALNSTIIVVGKSPLWVMTIKAAKSLWHSWLNTDISSRKLMIMIAITVFSLALFAITQRFVNLWLPPTYSAVALSFAYLFEKECASQKQNTRRYWLAVLLIFCIIQICIIGINMTTPLHLGDADTWSEIWELMARLPTARSGTIESLRILTTISLTYYVVKRIYQRHGIRIISFIQSTKQSIAELTRGLPQSQSLPSAILT